MLEQQIVITGANGQLGTELALALRKLHGAASIIATDIRRPAIADPAFRLLDVMDRDARKMRGQRPFLFSNLKENKGVDDIAAFVIRQGGLPARPLN